MQTWTITVVAGAPTGVLCSRCTYVRMMAEIRAHKRLHKDARYRLTKD